MALIQLNKEVLMKPPSSPIANHIFNVAFFYDGGSENDQGYTLLNDTDRSMIAISVDLPSFSTSIVTRKFLGTEKSFPVYRSNGGETSLVFYAHTEPTDNDFIVYNFFKDIAENREKKYYHHEFYRIFDKIEIKVGDMKANEIYTYHLMNCIVTKIDQGSLSYEGSEAVKFTMTVHYDDWFID